MIIYWVWFSRLPYVSTRQKLNLLRIFGDPEGVYNGDEQAYAQVEGITEKAVQSLGNKDLGDAHRILRECSEKSISIVAYSDSAYPKRLKNIEEPPLVLYYKGCLPNWQEMPPIGIVGTRRASLIGLKNARRMGYEIAASGALVISGGADGIDTYALEGALQAGKRVVAVLGFGADVVYPAKNRALFQQIEKQGCLLTEYVPGTPANAWNFPQRNRIISGLSAGLLVVEAPERSGALNTARHAMDQGRDVFVVPGNIGQECCAGSNGLLRERAIAAMNGWDVVREYETLYPNSVRRFSDVIPEPNEPPKPKTIEITEKKPIDNGDKSHYSVLIDEKLNLTGEETQVLACLTPQPRPVDTVLAQLELPAGKVLSILTMLALKGVVKNHPGNCVSLGSGHQK